MRQWQAGDLVQDGERWIVLDAEGAAYSDGAILLAAADAPLWKALKGLPGARPFEHDSIFIRLEAVELQVCRFPPSGRLSLTLNIPDHEHSNSEDQWHRWIQADFEARGRDYQKEGALRQYIAQHKETK